MPPDIFTKVFQDKNKWKKARQLINIVVPEELGAAIGIHDEIHSGIQEKTALVADAFPCSSEHLEVSNVWKRVDMRACNYKMVQSGGPAWESVFRRVIRLLDSGLIIDDEEYPQTMELRHLYPRMEAASHDNSY